MVECATCVTQSHASLFAQARGHDFDAGNHIVFVVNMNDVLAWKFTLNVVDYGSGQPFLGSKVVTVTSSEAAPTDVITGLSELKDIGMVNLYDDIVLRVTPSASDVHDTCLSAGGGGCPSLVAYLQARPETAQWHVSMGRIKSAWYYLYEQLTGDAPKLFYVVQFIDGSLELYIVVTQGGGFGIQPVDDTATDTQGQALVGGNLNGWNALNSGTGTFSIRVYGSGGTGGCANYTITITGASSVESISSSSC